MRTDRRGMLTLLAIGLAKPALAQAPAMSRMAAYTFSFPALDGDLLRLADYAGRPILVVNTASLCGYTPQYAALQEQWTRFRARGLMIVAVPSNDFGSQEPGSEADIAAVAHQNYGVTFALAKKAEVRGESAHPFYKWAAAERPLDLPRWNFHKYLVGHQGRIVAAFSSSIEPIDARVITAVEKELDAAK